MGTSQSFSAILPTHPDILPIINDLRDKYNIPKADPSEDLFSTLIAEGLDIESMRAHVAQDPPAIRAAATHAQRKGLLGVMLQGVRLRG